MAPMGPRGKFFPLIPLLTIFSILALSTSCLREVDLDRPAPERGTLGEELHAIWLKDTRRGVELPDERTALLEERRQDFVSAVDRAVPPGTAGDLDTFLRSFVPAVDSGYFPALTRRISQILAEASTDQELLDALADPALYVPADFLPPRHAGQYFWELTRFPDTPALLVHLGHELAQRDGLNDAGQPDLQRPSSFSDLLRSLADAMDPLPDTEGSSDLAILLRDLFLIPDNRYRAGAPSRRIYVAPFDDRGVPVVARDNNGSIPFPFIADPDDPTRAALDDQRRFLMQNGDPIAIAPLSDEPVDNTWFLRDYEGRAEFSPGQFAFRYIDISDTALPYLVRMTSDLAFQGSFYHLMEALRELLGPAVPQEDRRGFYVGFDENHPVIDLMDALVTGLSVTDLPDVLDLIVRYIDRQTDDLAYLFYALNLVLDQLADAPGADIADNQTLLFDLLDILREITADPALFADVMDALRAPIVARTGEAMATLLTHRDRRAVPELDGPYDACFAHCRDTLDIGSIPRYECIRACPSHELFSEPMDLGAPESKTNRSMLQRLFHLLWDTAGAPYTMEITEAEIPGFNLADMPPMLHLPGSAEAFVRAVAGQLVLTDYITDEFTQSDLGQILAFLENAFPGVVNDETIAGVLSTASELFGARLDARPTPDQITRLFNQPQLRFEEGDTVLAVTSPRGNDGFVMAEHHADGLYAAEAAGLIDVLYPLAVAFSTHDREDLLPRFFVVIHEHYSSHNDLYLNAAGDPSPMKGSNVVSVEPALLTVLEEGAIFDALRGLALSTRNLTDDQGVAIDERLRQLIHQWIRNDEGYTMRSGASSITLADGRTNTSLSRVDVILDRASEMVRRAEGDTGEVSEHISTLVEDFLATVLEAELQGDRAVFTEEGVVALTTHVLSYLSRKAAQREAAGTFQSWLTEDVPDALVDTFTSRFFFALIDLLRGLQETDQGRSLIGGAIAHMGNTDHRADITALMAYGLFIQAYDVDALLPTGRFLTEALDPDRSFATEPFAALPTSTIFAHVLRMAGEGDTQGHGVDVLGRATLSGDGFTAPASTLGDIILRYLTDHPDGVDHLSATDFASAFLRLSTYLTNSQRGLERYFRLVELREAQ